MDGRREVYDISDPGNIELHVAVVCPGGQGDVSIYGDLLFMSAQETRGRLDCGTEGVQDSVSVERFRGVRIFDVSNLEAPRQVAAVQTCRGSHTHTVVTDPDDDENVYVYVSGTSGVRPSDELPGCSGLPPEEDPNTSYFRIEVIRVPLANPEEARIVSMPRLFADPETGEFGGLWQGGDHGEEIAFLDRGPLSEEEMFTGGYWSTYWNNGFIYGAEITRGLDIFRLEPGEHLSRNEIDAANMVQVEEFNAQLQPMFTWPAHPAVAGSYLDQLERAGNIQPSLLQSARAVLAAGGSSPGADVAGRLRDAAAMLDANADEVDAGERLGDAARQRWLAQAMRELAAAME